MLYKAKLYLKQISSYRRILGFSILLCVSTSVYGDVTESDFVYLDCDLVRSEDGKKDKSYSFQIYYRFNLSTNDIEVYQTNYNLYRTQCDISECSITDSELNIKSNSENYFMTRTINRQSGSYSEFISKRFPNQKHYITVTMGSCNRGRSKIVKGKRF
jgi:hypothetical protein